MRKISILLLSLLVIPFNLNTKTLNSQSDDVTYDIHPLVHNIEYGDETIELPKRIKVSFSDEIDNYTKKEAYNVLSLKHVSASTKDNFSNYVLNISTYEGKEDKEHFEKLDAYTLDIDENEISIIGKDDKSCFYALQTLREIFNQSDSSIRELSIKDYSNSYYRGVIQGLYGVPYNNFEIKDMIEFISYYKGNTFFYGPRHDSYFRTAWRDLLPDDELIMLKELVEFSKERKVNYYFGVNPVETNQFEMKNYDRDIKVFLAKFEQAYSVGVRNFFVSCDDVETDTIDDELQVRFMNELAAWCKEKGDCGRILLTPSRYCGMDGEPVYDYLSTLSGLDETIDLYWTGKYITSALSTGDFENFTKYTGRKAVFWLNWPVNDYAPTKLIMSKGEMLDITYNDDEAPFLGVISNPQILPYPSYLAIYQCLDYSWNYKDFDLNNVYDSAFERIEENEPEALSKVCSYLANASKYFNEADYDYRNSYFEESPTLKLLINEYHRLKENNESLENIKKLIYKELNATIEAVNTLINHGSNRNLIKQLEPYILAVKDTCNATIKYLELEDLIATGKDNILDLFKEAQSARKKIKENKAVVLDYTNCNEDKLPVEVCTAILTPFLTELSTNLDYEASLLLGLPTGIIYRGFNGIYSGSFDNMFDDNEDTFVWLDGYGLNNSYVQIDLEEVKEISSLKVTFKDGNGTICYLPNIDISLNGKDFEPLTTINSNTVELDLIDNPKEARYIRLGNFTGHDLDWWVSIAEVKINYINENDKRVTMSNIKGVYEGNVNNMFDGDPSTYCWFNDYPEKDAYVQIDYRTTQEISNINILFKDGNNGGCYMPYVEYSLDGVTFNKLMDVNSNSAYIEFDEPISFRYLRLTNNSGEKLGNWVSIAEIMFNISVPKVEYTGIADVFSGTYNDMFDYDDNTYLWFSSGAENEGYVQIEYDQVVTAKEFRVVFFNGNTGDDPIYTECYLSDLEVSIDGKEWVSIETGNNDNLIEVTLDEEVSFKYIRLKNNSGESTPHWIAISSIEFK